MFHYGYFFNGKKIYMEQIEDIFEGFFWNSRLLVFLAVRGGLLSSLTIYYMTAVDVTVMLSLSDGAVNTSFLI